MTGVKEPESLCLSGTLAVPAASHPAARTTGASVVTLVDIAG
jgi:hypothetical protein